MSPTPRSTPIPARCRLRRRPADRAAASLALATLALGACAAPQTDVGRPPITLGGYRLATIPAADPGQFLGRRFDPAIGEAGDRPCGAPPVEHSQAGHHLSAEYQLDQRGGLEIGALGFLTAGLDVSRFERIEVELTTSSKASITVPTSCADPVVYDAIAGSIEIRYHARRGVSVEAATEGLRGVIQARGGASYRVDEQRRVASLTLDPDLYVAYRVHHNPPAPERRGPSGKKVLVVGSLLAAGLGLFHLGYRTGPDCEPGIAGGEFCMANPGQVMGMVFGSIIALTGVGLIAVDF